MAKRTKKYTDNLDQATELLKETKESITKSSTQRINEFFTENDYEVEEAREVVAPYVLQQAPTLSPGNNRNPRCTKIAYSRGKEQLVVRFYDGTWWYYNAVPSDMWDDLRTSDSTGGWLHESGLNAWDDMGPFNPAEMSRANRVQFNAP